MNFDKLHILASDISEHVDAVFTFITLAHKAESVIMRRGWSVRRETKADGSFVFWVDAKDHGNGGLNTNDWHPSEFQTWLENTHWNHPFIALCEADEWYTKNVEKK